VQYWKFAITVSSLSGTKYRAQKAMLKVTDTAQELRRLDSRSSVSPPYLCNHLILFIPPAPPGSQIVQGPETKNHSSKNIEPRSSLIPGIIHKNTPGDFSVEIRCSIQFFISATLQDIS
jgi:hypothetical protein